jgi:hypothetical protein
MMRERSTVLSFQQPPPSTDQPKSFDLLLKQSVDLYRRAWLPLITIAAIGSLTTNSLLAFLTPSTILVALTWLVVAQVPTFIAEAALITLVWRVERDQPAEISSALWVAFGLGPRYVAGRILAVVILSVGITTIVGIPVALFLFARWGLFGPAVVVEQRSTIESLRVSWNMVTNRTFRTLGMLVIMQLAVFAVSFTVQTLTGATSLGAQVLLATFSQAAVIPLASTFTLLLYEDYARLDRREGALPLGP